MSDDRHTPGPWAPKYNSMPTSLFGPAGENSLCAIAQCHGPDAAANMRLIAAAPDLNNAVLDAWKALQWISAYDSEDGILAAAIAKIEAALSKANTFNVGAVPKRDVA